MNVYMETRDGMFVDVNNLKFSYSCGPRKASFEVQMSPQEAINLSRRMGRKVKIHIDGSCVWWGFLTDVSTSEFVVTVNDIKNHLLSVTEPTLTDLNSIQNHGILSGSYDNDGTDISTLSKPVLRSARLPSDYNDNKERVRVTCEGPLDRLNRVIYKNSDAVVSGTGNQVKIGGLEVDQIISQQVVLPFDSNFVSITYSVEGNPAPALFEVLDAAFVPIVSTNLTAGATYQNLNFPTVPANTVYRLRVTHLGPDAFNIPTGPNILINASGNVTGSYSDSMGVIIRNRTDLNSITTDINSFMNTTSTGFSDILRVFGRGGDSFIDTAYVKLGDYVTDLALLRDLSMVLEVNGWDFYVWILDNEIHRMDTSNICEYKYMVPYISRSSCGATATSEDYQGFIVSNWYGQVSYTQRKDEIKYS